MMNMMKNNIKYLIVCGIILLTSACTDDEKIAVEPGKDAIQLSAKMLRSDGVNGDNVYFTATLDNEPSKIYIKEMLINFADPLSATPTDIIFPLTTPFYPLQNNAIRIFAYSGKSKGWDMVIKAGNGATYDAVLSNQGYNVNDLINMSPEGTGTFGSSTFQAKLLQFRHVMTQVIVDVVVDETVTTPVDPKPSSIQFTMDGVVASGQYGIKSIAPQDIDYSNPTDLNAVDKATTTSGTYTLQKGINYLVPNGENLEGKKLTSLKIDDYTATPADLNGFTIATDGGTKGFYLLPGFSYHLTFKVRRLEIVSITLKKINWIAKEVDDNVSYDPQHLIVDLGADYNSDPVSKIVLHTTNNKQYVGESTTDGGTIEYIVLPPPTETVNKADLYTKKGLLLTTAITPAQYNSTTKELTLDLSAGGMVTQNPLAPNSETNPYLITTPIQFLNLSKDLAAFYKQASVIDLKALTVSGADATFAGFDDFTGTYDGNGFWLANMNITGPGLFKTNKGTLRNIRIFTGTIDGSSLTNQPIGSMCAINEGTIVACTNEVPIKASRQVIVGGICGENETNGQIIACLNTGDIPLAKIVGGIAGDNRNQNEGAISACINTGSLDGMATSIGGICGISLPGGNPIIRTCFWLIGSAQKHIGSREVAVGSLGVMLLDTSSLAPDKLRNGISLGSPENERVINRLNLEIARYPIASTTYQYVIDFSTTGITWPVPVKK